MQSQKPAADQQGARPSAASRGIPRLLHRSSLLPVKQKVEISKAEIKTKNANEKEEKSLRRSPPPVAIRDRCRNGGGRVGIVKQERKDVGRGKRRIKRAEYRTRGSGYGPPIPARRATTLPAKIK
jgi:hypothetical protein